MKALVYSGACILLVMACVKPEACLSADKTTLMVGEVTQFRSCSKHANYVEWDFGDGTTKMGSGVSHGYMQTGTYTVKLTAHFYENRKKPDTETINNYSTITCGGFMQYFQPFLQRLLPCLPR